MTRKILLLSLLALTLPPASAARAGTPFQIGTGGKDPALTVDPVSGTMHAVWSDDPEQRSVRYCRVPRGGTACDITRDLPLTAPDTFSVDEPKIVRAADGTLHVVTTRYVGGDTWLWSSADGGATWSASSRISDADMGTDATDPVLGPQAGEITIPTWNSGRRVFSARLDGGDALNTDFAELPPAVPAVSFLIYNLATAVAPDGSLIATADSDTREATGPVGVWRVAPGGDPTLPGSWSAPPTVLGAGSDSRLAGGPSGVFLATLVPGNAFAVRKLQSGTTFGAPATVIGGSNASVPDLTVDASGHIGLAWRVNGSPNFEIWLSRSSDGSSFAPGVRVADDPSVIVGTQIALAQDGNGFVVWESSGKTIKAASTDQLPVPTPGPAPTPAPTPTPTASATRQVRSSVPGASITFGVPSGCVQPGQTFRVTLKWKKQKRKGNKFVKVTRADFYIGTKVVKRDRKVPFVQTLKVTASARRGSSITVRARAFIKVKKGKSPKKSIRATIRVCA